MIQQITGYYYLRQKEKENKALKINSNLCCFIEPPPKWCLRVEGVLEMLPLA